MIADRDRAPRKRAETEGFREKGLIIVHTGDGKGKTTAAFGTAMRAIGRGKKVAVVQFMKGKWKTGEIEAAKQFGDLLKIVTFGEGFTWETEGFEKDVQFAKQAWEKCLEFLHDDVHEVVIFDEVLYALKHGFLETAEVVSSLKGKPPLKHVILTGQDVRSEIVDLADLVTEMRCVKHPYQKGIKAQPGIEY